MEQPHDWWICLVRFMFFKYKDNSRNVLFFLILDGQIYKKRKKKKKRYKLGWDCWWHICWSQHLYGWVNQLLKQRFRMPPLCWKKKVLFQLCLIEKISNDTVEKETKICQGETKSHHIHVPKSIWELKVQTKLWQILQNPWPHAVVSLALFLYCLLEEGWTPHEPALQIATIEAEAKASITTMSFEPTPAQWNKLRLRRKLEEKESLHLPSSSAVGRRLPSSPGTWSSSRTAGCAASLCTGEH